ncbi:succinoglycan biosynthesis protein ExoL [Sphingomonas sp. UYP23]
MSGETGMDRTVGYLVHDLNDAAVERRVGLFVEGGARVRVGGFRRRALPDTVGAADCVIDLGVTRDMRLVQRIKAIMANLAKPADARRVVVGADVIVARNLEMLAIAVRIRKPEQRLVYECLDLHRLLLSDGTVGKLLRKIERRLLADVAMIVTSSPAYIEKYFHSVQGYRKPILLVENKVPRDAPTALPAVRPAHGHPWQIGWFGIIRCRKSLMILASFAAASAGRVEVLIAGRPNLTEIPDFDAIVAASPGFRFTGPYRLEQLPSLYASVDFAWAVDFYEEGLNSKWLLPNRLYESLAAGVPPLALCAVEVGCWLDRTRVGRTFDDLEAEVMPFLMGLEPTAYASMREAVAALPAEKTRFVQGESLRIVSTLLGTTGMENGA